MDIEFDPGKDAINRDKHGVSLTFGTRVFEDDNMLLIGSHRAEDGENRWKAIGMVDGRLWTAVHVPRDKGIRFISVRKSNNGEYSGYHRNPR